MNAKDDDRITALEETVAHQSKTIDELSDQLTEQWKIIDRLKRALESLGERMESMASTDAPVVAKPPHY
jgi:SlyX protein